ncbi:hypothetical protein [Paenibacillus sp. sgz302251]|uniref:hypothetical protein n=1 Tax=Paenibacillus sp. sgz302251 TaxID=3414493 RepID=UPI003C7D99D2
MTFRKKMTASVLVYSMLAASLGVLPISQKGLQDKLGFVSVANAADSGLPSSVFLQRMNALHAALAAGDPADVEDVRKLRDEIAGLDEAANLQLLDPVWNKISAKLPESVDQAKLKTNLFRMVKAVFSIRYDVAASDLEAIRMNSEFRVTLKTISAAGGDANIVMDDFLVFLLGDGGDRKGVEGTISAELTGMSSMQLLSLLGNKQGITAVLLQASEKLLKETDAYKFSSILHELGVTPQDVRATVLNFQIKLQKDEPAINAMTVSYVRTAASASAKMSEDGRRHDYSLKVFGVDVPSAALKWEKVSGSEAVNVTPSGIVTIPAGVAGASAVIQAKLVNPYGGSNKLIFEKEVTLTAKEEQPGDVFPAEQFLERMNKLYAALVAGDPGDARDVRSLRDEIAGLDASKDQALLDPLWNAIALNLASSADQAQLKTSLFEMIKALGSFQYDPNASDLEAIRTNPEFRATLKTLAAAGGVSNITMDDFLIVLFGDGGERKGIEGAILDIVADMKPKEIAQLFGDKQKINAVVIEAMIEVLAESDDYALSKALQNLGVKSEVIRSTVLNFQAKLKYDEPAMSALAVAFIRSEVKPSVKITEDGRQHEYQLMVLGVEIPSSVLKWTKLSGSKDVKVEANGKFSIPKKVPSAAAVIQAAIVNPHGGEMKVIFKQEVTLVNDKGQIEIDKKIGEIFHTLDDQLVKLQTKLKSAKNDKQKVSLILEAVRAGNNAVKKIEKVDASKSVEDKAINEVKDKVNRLIMLIVRDLLDY